MPADCVFLGTGKMTYDHWKATNPADALDDLEPDDDDEFWCDECQGTGYIDCHCGGDLCVCEYHGEKPCPRCE